MRQPIAILSVHQQLLSVKQLFNRPICCCAFAQRALGKPLSKRRVTVANLIEFSPNRIGMHSEKKRLARERLTMSKMIGIYCSAHHDSSGDILCTACREFQNYTELRLQKCPYGEDKPTCANCPVHCYKPARKGSGQGDHAICRSQDVASPSATRNCPPAGWFPKGPGTQVSSRASKDCIREKNDKRPSPVYYTQRGSTIIAGVWYRLTDHS